MPVKSKTNGKAIREDFLREAARLLVTACPTTSAHIGSEAAALREATSSSRPSQSDTCPACGIVFIAGMNCTVHRGDIIKGPHETKMAKEHRPIEHHCHLCYRRSVVAFPVPTKPRLRTEPKTEDPPTPEEAHIMSEVAKIARAPQKPTTILAKPSKKKRAKARKERLRLQNQLFKSRQIAL